MACFVLVTGRTDCAGDVAQRRRASRSMVFSVLGYVWTHPANHKHRFRALARAVAWQIYKRTTGRYWDFRVYGGLKLRCYPDSTSAGIAIYSGGYPDWNEMAFMKAYLREGDAFIDVGANIGVYTLYAASLIGPTGHVDSFEPTPRSAERLRENVALNGLTNVRVHQFAVSSQPGYVEFVVDADTVNHIVRKEEVGSQAIKVRCVRLDESLPPCRYAMAKIDVEGAEPMVLQGAERLLRECNPPVWLIEINGLLRRYGYEEEQLERWLSDRGYDLYLYSLGGGRLIRSDKPWLKSGNVFAIARSALTEVVNRLKTR